MNVMEEIRIEVFGRVQGVMFRHFVKENADRLGLNGFVKNKDDGSIIVVAQGEREVLEELLRAVQIGPQFSKVTGISYFWQKKSGKYDDFTIASRDNILEDQKKSILNLGKRIFNVGGKIPKHVAIIPDGNRRWARSNGFKSAKGHEVSKDLFIPLFEEAERLGIKYLTVWIFSTENWNRSKREINKLFDLFVKSFKEFEEKAIEKEIKFKHLGRKDRLPKKVIKAIEELEKATEKFDKFYVQICMDYGGRDEIVRAVNKLLRAGVHEVKEDDIDSYLDSSGIPDPDLIIRTSGEKRISGFMPYQATYSELYFTDVNFPDFGPNELRKAVEDFSKRKRTFGRDRD